MNKSGYVYVISTIDFTKIGLSCEPLRRVFNIQKGVPYKLTIDAIIPSENMFRLEKQLHKRFAEKRYRGEWFVLAEEDIVYLKSLIPSGFVYSENKRVRSEEEKQIEYFFKRRTQRCKNGEHGKDVPF